MAKKVDVVPVNRVRIDGVLYPYDDAKKDVTIQRELVDIWKGTPGKAGACMNAHCIIRNKKLFPHPVLAASVIKSRAYIIDKPEHVVRYILTDHDRELVQQHDEIAIGEPGTLVLRAPKGYDLAGTKKTRGKSGRHNPDGAGNKPLSRGEQARLAAAVGAGP